MRATIRLTLLAVAFALVTIFFGWWAVAAVGTLWGWLPGDSIRYPRILAAVTAGLAWLAILAVGEVGESPALLATVSGMFSVPGPLIVTATVGLGSLLAWLGTWLGTTGQSRG